MAYVVCNKCGMFCTKVTIAEGDVPDDYAVVDYPCLCRRDRWKVFVRTENVEREMRKAADAVRRARKVKVGR